MKPLKSSGLQTLIRKAQKGDAAELLRMGLALAKSEREVFRFTTKDFFNHGFGKRKSFNVLIATVEKKCVGYAAFHPGYDLGSATAGIYLIDLFVDKDHRVQQIGRKLMTAIGEVCKAEGRKWLSWHVKTHNPDAIAFYLSLKAKRIDSNQYYLEY